MAVYRKKPVEVEAVRFDGCEYVDDVAEPMFEGSFDIRPDWLTEAMAKREDTEGAVYSDNQLLHIVTLEGTVTASPGDFIIRGTAAELYPCKPEIFATIYDPVDEAGRRVLDGGYADTPNEIGKTELGGHAVTKEA